jgi:hypothetical protein
LKGRQVRDSLLYGWIRIYRLSSGSSSNELFPSKNKEMKSFTIFLLLAFIVALITAPDHEQFNKFLAKKGRNIGTCLGGTRHHSFKVYTLDYVDYCDPHATGANGFIPGLTKTSTARYLGLFGFFWKL